MYFIYFFFWTGHIFFDIKTHAWLDQTAGRKTTYHSTQLKLKGGAIHYTSQIQQVVPPWIVRRCDRLEAAESFDDCSTLSGNLLNKFCVLVVVLALVLVFVSIYNIRWIVAVAAKSRLTILVVQIKWTIALRNAQKTEIILF